jgi:hypothetical protein
MRRHRSRCSTAFSSQTTHTGHFYLAKLLLPLLTATAKNSPPGSVRVVNVSSIGHYTAPSEGIRWSTLSPGDDCLAVGKKVGETTLYNQSKLVMRRVPSDIIRSLICSPIGQRPLLERTRSKIRRRRHCFHLLTPRNHRVRSYASFGFFRNEAVRTNDVLRCLIRCDQFFIRWHRPCCG